MSQVTRIQSTPAEVPIASGGGFTLQAPGMVAEVREVEPSERVTRSDSGLHEEALLTASKDAGVETEKWFELDVVDDGTAAPGSNWTEETTRDGEPAVVLRMPWLGHDTDYAVLYTDESGLSRWFRPEEVSAPGAATRGGSGEISFHLPRESAPVPPEANNPSSPATRGPISKLGRRLVRVLSWATDGLVGPAANLLATQWETRRRPYALRAVPFGPADSEVPWDVLRGDRTLLLVHGTFSTGRGAFDALPRATLEHLIRLYNGRVFAFDHPTLHQSPRENARNFLERLPVDASIDLDMIGHSRGGLVCREIAERLAAAESGGRSVRVRKAVLVGAPNLGTRLTDGDHGLELLDRYTALLTELPDDAWTLGMEGVFAGAKLSLHGALTGLPGLRCMFPPGDYLKEINSGPGGRASYFAVTSRFRPRGPAILGRLGDWAAGKVFRDIFGEDNDGVVPTRGCFECAPGLGGFPIGPGPERLLVFGEDAGVNHINYFSQPKLSDSLVGWLSR